MINVNSLFKKFDKNISLSSAKRKYLQKSRDAIREKIKKYFNDNDMEKPFFCGQGSYMMGTIITPITDVHEYDLDDGVYLTEYKNCDVSKLPNIDKVHNWIKKSVKNHTNKVIDKNPCVRVVYARDYHLDLPIYIEQEDKILLAYKNKGWIESDPKEFSSWFADRVKNCGEELRRTVKYLKGWKDFINKDRKIVDLSGMILTVLAAKEFDKSSQTEADILLGTVTNIISKLKDNFFLIEPVEPKENLLEDTSTNIIKMFERLHKNLQKAYEQSNCRDLTKILRGKVFGERFPQGDDTEINDGKSEKFKKTDSPSTIGGDGESA